MTLRYTLFLLCALSLGLLNTASYAGDIISCDSFENCADGSPPLTNVILELQARIEALEAEGSKRDRNWQFGNAQGGGGGNVGLEISLPRAFNSVDVIPIEVAKFATFPGESISSVTVVFYSNVAFQLSAQMHDLHSPTPTSYRSANTYSVTGQGSNAYAQAAQVATLTFDPAITPTSSSMTLYLANTSTEASTPSIGIFQLIIE